MELLDYSDNATFNLKSSSESEEEYQIMSKYFNSQASDSDSSYTNDTEYDYGAKPPAVHDAYSYGNSFEVDGQHTGAAHQGIDYSSVQYFPQPHPGQPLQMPHHHQHQQAQASYSTMQHQHHHQLHHQSSAEDFARATAAASGKFGDITSSLLDEESKVRAHPAAANANSSPIPLMYNSQQQTPLHHTPMSHPSHTPIQQPMVPVHHQQQQQQQQHMSMSAQHTPITQRNHFQAPNPPMHQATPISAQSTPLQSNHRTPMQQQRPAPAGMPISPVLNLQEYPDMTTLVNSNSNLVVPMVDTAFVDHRICSVCSKRITRDMSRHMRTHQIIPRFQCAFPKSQCNHKSGRFNRPYDFKKHLLNRHFKFDNPEIKKIHNLSDKLNHPGVCPCGVRFISKDWLDEHILTNNKEKRCPCVDQ